MSSGSCFGCFDYLDSHDIKRLREWQKDMGLKPIPGARGNRHGYKFSCNAWGEYDVYSYYTKVMEVHNTAGDDLVITPLWDNWSTVTGAHINAMLEYLQSLRPSAIYIKDVNGELHDYSYCTICKRDWLAMF